MHVHLVVGQVQIPHGCHRDDGESLVDFEKIHVRRGPTGTLQYFAYRADGRGGKPGGFLGVARMGADLRAHRELAPRGFGATHEHQCRRAVGDRAGIGRSDCAAFAKGGLEMRDLFRLRLPRLLVLGHVALSRTTTHRHRHDLPMETAVRDGFLRPVERGNREVVLGFTGELVMLRTVFGEDPHETALVEGIFQAVYEHVVEHPAVTHAIAGACLLEQVGRVAHALHAAGHHDVVTARAKQIVGQHGGFHARAAHLVDGRASGLRAEPGAEGRLPGGCLTLPGGQHAAHDDFFHVLVRDTGVADGAGDAGCAQLGGGDIAEVPLKPAHGCARRTDDHYRIIIGTAVAHISSPHPVS